jgi:hypothetical protein
MSNGETVRTRVRLRAPSGRAFEQRVALRFPVVALAAARQIGRLPLGSRLRQALVCRGARLAAEALNRRDVDAILISYHPDYEFRPAHEFVDGGLMPPSYHGPRGYHQFVSDWSEVWGTDLRVELVEVIDLGSQIVTLWNVPARAQASGVALTGRWATVSTLKDGRVISDQVYLDHAEALEAVGLSD